MLQALLLTAAIILTVIAVLQWVVFIFDFHQKVKSRIGLTPTIVAINLWVIYYHL
jgi:hypothetical protein